MFPGEVSVVWASFGDPFGKLYRDHMHGQRRRGKGAPTRVPSITCPHLARGDRDHHGAGPWEAKPSQHAVPVGRVKGKDAESYAVPGHMYGHNDHLRDSWTDGWTHDRRKSK